ncbi:MAG: helix-turn-helix domain-containing protein [Oscillospiraceae bacterium]|nr:helix-turn-helix domain-containing protein [Oscillospiraceae bacterium]
MKFGDKLKSFRIAQGLTQEDLARRIGMKKQNISRYENSEREPNIRTAKAIADALGVTLQELTLGDSSSAPDNILSMPRMFGDVLRQLRLESKLTQKELSSILGVSESTVGMYERNQREPSFEMLEAIADFFNVDMDYLTGRSSIKLAGAFPPDNILSIPHMHPVPLLGTIACGDPILAQENIEGEVSAPEHVVADFALRCKGDSMINARIYDGDIVYIRQQARVDNGQIAAVLIGDEATLKRVYFYPESNKLVLNPENPAYEPLIFVGDELATVRILGRAVAFTSAVR